MKRRHFTATIERPTAQRSLDQDRLVECLRYYAFSHHYANGDQDRGAQARIALADVMGEK